MILTEEELIQIRRHLHQVPELALKEFKTHDYLLNTISGFNQDYLKIDDDMEHGNMLHEESADYNVMRTDVVSAVKYDLLGKIGANTKLTRKTVATILSKISPQKFNLYKLNPEEFIRKLPVAINICCHVNRHIARTI